MVHAQSSTDQRREMKREIFKTFHKRSYTGESPLRKIPTLPSTTYQTIRRAKTEAPLFTDRVWFPGEWEEVKAIILTPYYENHVPGHEDDLTWNAEPMVKDYANYYHKNDTIGPVEWDGKDTCTIRNKYKPALTQDEVRQALQEMLGQRATHIVPRFLYDGGTGHMDLYADAWNENGFVFSGMPERYGDWHDYITESGNIAYLNEQKSFSGRNYYTMARLPFPSDENGDFFKNENEYNLQYSRTYGKHHLHPQR